MLTTNLHALLSIVLLLARAHAAPSADKLTKRGPPRGVIIEHCTVPGVVALTFDDGPYIYTSHVLDVLDEYGAKATFFINGENWSSGISDPSTPWPDILKRMDKAGHQIGSHTWSHADLSLADSATRQAQVHQLEAALFDVIGKAPTYLRPPYASCDSDCLEETAQMGYHVVNFDVDTKDYLHQDAGDIGVAMETFSKALDDNAFGNSFLVLSHDTLLHTAESLVPYMLMEIKQRGYKAVTVGECLGDPVKNWYWGP